MSDEVIRSRILNQIEKICESIIENMYRTEKSGIFRFTINDQSYEWNRKSEDRQRRDFTRYLYVLSVVHRLVRTKARMNIRELFYSQVNLFQHQRASDMIVENIARHLCVDRRQLGFVATAKGLCAGSVKYQIVRSGETVDCHQTLNGQLIIDDDIEIIEREHPLRFILVVEKDTIFQHLLNDGFLQRYDDVCLITGRGQPDYATRSFVNRLVNIYDETPVYILTDCDIFGVLIASTYQSSFDHTVANRVRWLGIWPEEIITASSKFNFSCTLPIIDQREKRIIDNFLLRSDINAEWRRQVAFFQQHQRKMEIEAIYQNGSKSLINDYLHEKIIQHRWF